MVKKFLMKRTIPFKRGSFNREYKKKLNFPFYLLNLEVGAFTDNETFAKSAQKNHNNRTVNNSPFI